MINIPWKLIGYGVALGLLVWLFLIVNGWHRDSRALDAAKLALKNEIACKQGSHCMEQVFKERESTLAAAEKTLRSQNTLAKETEDALQKRLVEVDRHYLDATQRLAHLRVCHDPGLSGTAAPPAVAGEPGSSGPLDAGDGASLAGLGPILRDAEADAADYDAVREWYANLRRIRNAETPDGH